jgi:hypothetical protein
MFLLDFFHEVTNRMIRHIEVNAIENGVVVGKSSVTSV